MSQAIRQAYLFDTPVADPINSVPSSGGLTDGVQFDAVVNAGNGNAVGAAMDYAISGIIKTGNTAVDGVIEVLVVGQGGFAANNYPAGFNGSAGSLTLPNRNSIDLAVKRAFVIEATGGIGASYEFGPISIRSLFDGYMPRQFQVGIVHNTGDDTDGFDLSHIYYTPTYLDVA